MYLWQEFVHFWGCTVLFGIYFALLQWKNSRWLSAPLSTCKDACMKMIIMIETIPSHCDIYCTRGEIFWKKLELLPCYEIQCLQVMDVRYGGGCHAARHRVSTDAGRCWSTHFFFYKTLLVCYVASARSYEYICSIFFSPRVSLTRDRRWRRRRYLLRATAKHVTNNSIASSRRVLVLARAPPFVSVSSYTQNVRYLFLYIFSSCLRYKFQGAHVMQIYSVNRASKECEDV